MKTGSYTWTQPSNSNDQIISFSILKSDYPHQPIGGVGTLKYGTEAHYAKVSFLDASDGGDRWNVRFYAAGGWRSEWGRYSLFWGGSAYTLYYIVFCGL